MYVESQRDDVRRLVVFTVSGTVTAAELIVVLDQQAAGGTWSYSVLYDEREAEVDLSAEQMRSIASHAVTLSRVHGPRGPVAIVTAKDVDYGVNRMVSAYADAAGYQIQVFRTMQAALEWLHQGVGDDR